MKKVSVGTETAGTSTSIGYEVTSSTTFSGILATKNGISKSKEETSATEEAMSAIGEINSCNRKGKRSTIDVNTILKMRTNLRRLRE